MSNKPRFREGQKVFVPLYGVNPKYSGVVSHMVGNKVIVEVENGIHKKKYVYNPEEVKLSKNDTNKKNRTA